MMEFLADDIHVLNAAATDTVTVSVKPDSNPWIPIYDSAWYQISTRWWPALIYQIASISSIFYLRSHLALVLEEYERKVTIARRNWKCSFQFTLSRWSYIHTSLLLSAGRAYTLSVVTLLGGVFSSSALPIELMQLFSNRMRGTLTLILILLCLKWRNILTASDNVTGSSCCLLLLTAPLFALFFALDFIELILNPNFFPTRHPQLILAAAPHITQIFGSIYLIGSTFRFFKYISGTYNTVTAPNADFLSYLSHLTWSVTGAGIALIGYSATSLWIIFVFQGSPTVYGVVGTIFSICDSSATLLVAQMLRPRPLKATAPVQTQSIWSKPIPTVKPSWIIRSDGVRMTP